jgi:diguanylate cyclase (GGDEF)-like protein
MRRIRDSIFSQFLLFACALFATATALAATTIVSVTLVERRTVEGEQQWAGGAMLLGEIDAAVAAFRLSEFERALAADPTTRRSSEAIATLQRDSIADLERQYVALLGKPVSQSDLAAFRAAWQAYQTLHDGWVRAAIGGPSDKAAFFGSSMDRQYRATDLAIEHLVDRHHDQGLQNAKAVERITDVTIALTGLIYAALLTLMILTMFRARARLIRPLLTITRTMSLLAKGHHEALVPEMHRQDEIGSMAMACEVFRVNVLALDKSHKALQSAEEQAQSLARHDALTGLPNRRVFTVNLEAAIQRARSDGAACSVLLIDLDGFKKVNDLQGHQIGDTVLCEVARRMEATIRKQDTVARLGGDEFAIIAEGEADEPEHMEGVRRLAVRLISAISQPVICNGVETHIGASIGIAPCRADAGDVGLLLRAADIAMYRAKQSGRGTFRFFEQKMDDELREQELVEKDLMRAITDEVIQPYFQPLVDIRTNHICGFEALARWRHPTRGFISPDVFIPLASQLNLMTALTASMLRQACREAKQWPADIRIAVNFPPSEFTDPALPSRILAILAEEELPPSRLEVEITEDALVSDMNTARAIVTTLQKLGITVCLDDFGTGYSSLYHLRELKFDKVKIDRSFVQSTAQNGDSQKIIDAILGLTKSLGLPVVAEGIENKSTLQHLRLKGCEYGQGYYFAKAMSGDDARTLLKRTVAFPVTELA